MRPDRSALPRWRWLARALPLLLASGLGTPAAALYLQTNLVSDLANVAAHQDASLVNPWGLASSPTSPFFVADRGTGVATAYDASGAASSLVVTVLPAGGAQPPSAPTGLVFNATTDFELAAGTRALYLFATADGTISGWHPSLGTSTIREVDESPSGSVYTGLALGTTASGSFLYAADFANATVDVFGADFKAAALAGSFLDPNLPAGYAPFNIQNLGGELFVTYAVQAMGGQSDVPGPGNGIVDVFDLNGNLLRRLISASVLDSPWGLALAPADFGELSNALLVANAGDGTIHGFDPLTGMLLGTLEDAPGHALAIEGLRGLAFGSGAAANGSTSTLFFTAGIPGDGAVGDHGLFGTLTPVPEPSELLLVAFGLLVLALVPVA